MGVLIKTIYLLCIASASINAQLGSSLNLHTPVLNLDIGGNNRDQQSIANSLHNSLINQAKTCFCIPTNTDGLPITNHVDPLNDTQRLIVYVYKNKGDLKIYVPNKNKQQLLPELDLDYSEGDIIKPVNSQSIVDIFDQDIVQPSENIVVHPPENIATVTKEVITETEMLDIDNVEGPNVDPNKLWNPVVESADLPVHVDNEYIISPNTINHYTNDKPSDDVNDQITISTNEKHNLEVDIPVEESINISEPSSETQEKLYVDQTSQITNIPHSKPENVNNLDVVIDNQETITNLEESDQQQSFITITDSEPPINQAEDIKINFDTITKYNNQIPQSYSTQNSQSYLTPDQYSIQILKPNLLTNPYISFRDWFDLQLNHFVIYNIETQMQVAELREKIKKVLEDNGMIISVKGIVTDKNGHLVRMNNLRLRPILIGSTIDAQNFSYQPNLAQSKVSYVQLIEVILINPPKLLGTLVLGTVYLPRKIQGKQILSLDSGKNNIIANKYGWSNAQGCSSCSLNPMSRTSIPGLRYPDVLTPGVRSSTIHQHIPEIRKTTVPYSSYGSYYALPFRRKILRNGLTYNRPLTATSNPYRYNNNVANNGRVGLLDRVFGPIGSILFDNPSRRLLGGSVPQGPQPGPKSYPNDEPGFRIIGGNAATSSGTPLANKGRSGFEKPSHII